MGSQKTIIKPRIIQWARKRTGLSNPVFAKRMKVPVSRIDEWESGKTALTFVQAKKLASLSLLPFGALFLSEIPKRDLNLPDFRTLNNDSIGDPSPELEATVLEMQKKQEWLHDYLKENDASELSWVGSLSIQNSVYDSANIIQNVLNSDNKDNDDENIQKVDTWKQNLSSLMQKMEDAGITVIRNGIVGNKTDRKLNVDEFRGFVLVDSLAPLIFINGRDDKSPQMFTLIHELVHLFLGKGGLIGSFEESSNKIERYCNKVAAEFLVPEQQLQNLWKKYPKDTSLEDIIKDLSNKFKVSLSVIIWKCKDSNLISSQDAMYLKNLFEPRNTNKKQSGGNYYANQKYRVGYNFARVVISELLDHNISYGDAFDLLQVKSIHTLNGLAKQVGLSIS